MIYQKKKFKKKKINIIGVYSPIAGLRTVKESNGIYSHNNNNNNKKS